MTAKTDSHAYSNLTNCDTNNATRIGHNKWSGDGRWPADFCPPNKKEYYQHLDRINSGQQNGHNWQNKAYNTYTMNRDLIQCMTDKLRLDQWEVKKAIQWFDGLQRSNMGIKSRVVAFTTCAYLVHRLDDSRVYHPQTKLENRDYFFEKCREDFDISHEWFERVYGKVSHKIRNNELSYQRHDTYEVDGNAQQTWRTRTKEGEGWL